MPPLIKKGTSAPIFAPILSSFISLSPKLYSEFNPIRVAAAFADPPATPLPTGILFSMDILTPRSWFYSWHKALYAL